MFDLYNSLIFLAFQVTTQPGTEATGTGDGAAAPAAGGGMSQMLIFMPLMIVMLLVFMSLTGKPQQKEQQRVKELMNTLKKNDRVVTAGGIVGTVVNINSDSEFLTVRIDESTNTKMQVLKQSVVRVLKESGAASEESKKS